MNDQPAPPPVPEQPLDPDHGSEPEWQRRRRLATVFGEVLPESTSDDRPVEAAPDEPATEAWLRAQVPPHHGD